MPPDRSRSRTTAVLLTSVGAALAGCAPAHRATPAIGDTATHGVVATPTAMIAALARTAAARHAARAAWPGFDPATQALLAVVDTTGPVYLLDDRRPPPEFVPVARVAGLAVRGGAPPDTLRGLRLGFSWNGATTNATAVGFAGGDSAWYVPHLLVHEAFHTYQAQRRLRDTTRFRQPGDPSFATGPVEARVLLDLEGAALADALRARDAADTRGHAARALALRRARCRLAGADACHRERALEQGEGTATYVATRALGEAAGYGGPRVWQDAMAAALAPTDRLRRADRWRFYDSGHAWLLLLRRLAPAGWEAEVETRPPDAVLAEALRWDPAAADSLVAVALRSARAAAARTFAEREPARPAIARTGVALHVAFGAVPRSTETTTRGADGSTASVIAFGGNRMVLRAPAEPACCPGRTVVATVAGRVAHVDGRPVPLDRPGDRVTGALTLVLPEVELHLPRASLHVRPDTIRVQALPPSRSGARDADLARPTGAP